MDHRFSNDDGSSIALSTKQLFPDRSSGCSDYYYYYYGDQINEKNRNPQILSNGSSNSQFRVNLEAADGSAGRRKRSIQEMNGHSNYFSPSPPNQSSKRPNSDPNNNYSASAAIIITDDSPASANIMVISLLVFHFHLFLSLCFSNCLTIDYFERSFLTIYIYIYIAAP